MSLITETTTLNVPAAVAFAGKIGDVLNAGALAVMMSVGHRLRLFDIMARLPPSTSAEIAGRAWLAERHVRQWLGVMVKGRIVHYDSAAKTYHLPAEHAASLTRGAPLGNLAAYAQVIALMALMQERPFMHFKSDEGFNCEDIHLS